MVNRRRLYETFKTKITRKRRYGNMKRTPLSIGSTIQAKGGSSYTYIIDRVIGDGASSIVYEAHYVDHSNHKHYIRLKECYPYQSSIERNGNNLIWSNENERTNDIAAFKSGYDALMKDQKSNYIVHAFDQFESNNTMYIVMDANEGVTFDKTDFESLKDILSTIKLSASSKVGSIERPTTSVLCPTYLIIKKAKTMTDKKYILVNMKSLSLLIFITHSFRKLEIPN